MKFEIPINEIRVKGDVRTKWAAAVWTARNQPPLVIFIALVGAGRLIEVETQLGECSFAESLGIDAKPMICVANDGADWSDYFLLSIWPLDCVAEV